jgi:TetR/AcrR family transcriptional regulator, regulator of cefoperazone and chloramphenicol sensitivity
MAAGAVSADRSTHDNRGANTRQRLIHSALGVFGEYGFHGASTRMLAERAGANLAAIPYYFGGKEGLYRAAAEFIVEFSRRELQPVIDRAERMAAERKRSRPAASALLEELLERFSSLVIGSPEVDSWAIFIMREQLHPGAAFEILYEGMMKRLFGSASQLLAILLRMRSDDPRLIITTQTVFGQAMMFRSGRAAALRQLGWKEITDDRLKLIQSVVRENLGRITGQIK